MKAAIIRNSLILAFISQGVITTAFTMDVGSDGFTEKQRRAMANLASTPAPEDKKSGIPKDKEQGNIKGVTSGKVKQTFKSSEATNKVSQGNIDSTTVQGDIEQEFN